MTIVVVSLLYALGVGMMQFQMLSLMKLGKTLLSLLESLLLCVLGAALGVGLAAMVYNTPAAASLTTGLHEYFPSFAVTPGVMGEALGIGLLLGLFSGILPAAIVARLDALKAMRVAD